MAKKKLNYNLDKSLLKAIKVEVTNLRKTNLINVQTGLVEQEILTGLNVHGNLGDGYFVLQVHASWSTPHQTDMSPRFHIPDEYTVDQVIALYHVFQEQREKYKNYFDNVDIDTLSKEAAQRRALHSEVVKEEERYKKQLLKEEIKRMAKENVDKSKPPLKAMLPNKNIIEEIK